MSFFGLFIQAGSVVSNILTAKRREFTFLPPQLLTRDEFCLTLEAAATVNPTIVLRLGFPTKLQ